MKKVFATLFIASLIITGCSSGDGVLKKPIKSINYNIVDTYSNNFNANTELKTWYLNNYKNKGKETLNLDGRTYILISLGEKRSGGYNLEIVDITATDKILINTKLTEPSPEQIKTMIITYPHLLIAIPQDDRNIVWENSIVKS